MDVGEQAWKREIEALTDSVALLIARCEELRREESRQRGLVESLREEVRSLQEQLRAASASSRAEMAGRAFGPNSDNSREARELIKSMVREVDACISLLRS